MSLTDQADGYVIADAVMLLPPGSPPNSAVWTPNVPQAGQYEVYAWWSAASNRATNATYTVTNAQGSTPIAVNQQANGGAWNLLGTYSLAPGTADTITLTDQANGYVIADAIRLVPVQTQAQLYFIEVDHLNTPRLVADATGTTVWRWDQAEPFGDSPADENPGGAGTFDLPLRLPGQYYDAESGLHYNYFRDYDPQTGRYVQSDLVGLRGGINSYTYVSDDPLALFDLAGLVQWTGQSYNGNISGLFGAGLTFLDLWSECKCNKRYHILVITPAVVFGFGLKATGTIANVDLDDGSNCPNPSAFEGFYMSAAAGVTVGPGLPKLANPGFGRTGIGASISASKFGSVTSISTPQHQTAVLGRDASITGSVGWDYVKVLHESSCCAK